MAVELKKHKAEEKKARAERKEKLERLKTRSQWLKEAQIAFNAYIRVRDQSQPCISCGARDREFWDAGHYRSVGAAPQLRFHEDNCHKQCIPCNQYRSGNAVEYRLALVARLGIERVAALESSNTPAKYSIEDAKRIKAEYKAKLKALRAANEMREAA